MVSLSLVNSYFYPILSGLGGIYLFLSSSLAYKGSSQYFLNTQRASGLLLVFFISIIGFLMFFAGVFMLIVYQNRPEVMAYSFISLILFVAFGIGSYFIEVLYLFYSTEKES